MRTYLFWQSLGEARQRPGEYDNERPDDGISEPPGPDPAGVALTVPGVDPGDDVRSQAECTEEEAKGGTKKSRGSEILC